VKKMVSAILAIGYIPNLSMRGLQPLLDGRIMELLGASTQLAICYK
jgi:hypothetical protein